MREPVLHPRTKAQLKSYLKQPAQGLLLAGPEGSGKYFLARWLAEGLGFKAQTVEAEEGKRMIAIDQIRSLYSVTRTGAPLVIVVRETQNLTTEAQNAFLKLLEEPPRNTRFILTVSSQETLLPTIKSRCQFIEILSPLKSQFLEYGKEQGTNESAISRTMLISQGLFGLFSQLLGDSKKLQAHDALLSEAKQFYSATTYQRHLALIEHNYERRWVEELLKGLALIIHTLLSRHAGSKVTVEKLHRQSELLHTTFQAVVTRPGNPKIHLSRLAEEL